MGMRKDEPFNMFVDKDIQDVYPRMRKDCPKDEDIKQIMAENKDILFCSKCNTPLEVVEEPMIRIRHYYCSKCKENKAGRAY